MMKRIQKRGVVVAAVLLLVCAAMYLNWRYAEDVAVEGKMLGESTLVSAEVTEDTAGGEGSSNDYFAAARLSRQQARDSATALLEEASALEEELASEEVSAAAESLQVIAAYTIAEAQIENLVTAKGYADCVAFMGEESISVVVSNGDAPLEGEDIAKITDIVTTQTSYTADQIKILEADGAV